MTDKQVDEMCRKLRIAFGVETTDDLVKKMVNRFLAWKLPNDFSPDAGISFKPYDNYEHDDHRWPIGTNLLHAGQAKELIEYLLGMVGEDAQP